MSFKSEDGVWCLRGRLNNDAKSHLTRERTEDQRKVRIKKGGAVHLLSSALNQEPTASSPHSSSDLETFVLHTREFNETTSSDVVDESDDEDSTSASSISSSSFPNQQQLGDRESQEVLHQRKTKLSWDSDLTTKSSTELVEIAVSTFESLGLLEHFGISRKSCEEFIQLVRDHYSSAVAFHTFQHAVTVMQISYLMVSQDEQLQHEVLSKEDVLALLVAAICHDLDHDGRSNSFHRIAKTKRGVLYGEVNNVQESHHLSICFEILDHNRNGFGMFSSFSTSQIENIKATIQMAILNTDLGKHFDLHAECQNVFPTTENLPSFKDRKACIEALDKRLIVALVVHCADISNPVRSFKLYAEWTRRLTNEFLSQVEEEKKFSMAVTEMMACKTQVEIAKREIGFIETFVIPTYKLLATLTPKLSQQLEQASRNVATLKQIESGDGKPLGYLLVPDTSTFYEEKKM